MRKFLKELDGIQKEDLKQVLAMPGTQHLVSWIVAQKSEVKENAATGADSWEEVLKLRGEAQGYNSTLKFIGDAVESLRNYTNED